MRHISKLALVGIITFTLGVFAFEPADSGDLTITGNPYRGRSVYLAYCFICHGADGKGDGPYADRLIGPAPRDLNDSAYFSSISDQDIYNVISKGGVAYKKSIHMKPQGFRLTRQNITDLVSFVRFLNGESLKGGAPIASFSSKELFSYYCASCHGESGDGRGVLSRYLPYPAANLTKKRIISNISDEDLYAIISKGKPSDIISGARSYMPSWEKALSGSQIKGLVGYIKNSLAK